MDRPDRLVAPVGGPADRPRHRRRALWRLAGGALGLLLHAVVLVLWAHVALLAHAGLSKDDSSASASPQPAGERPPPDSARQARKGEARAG